MKIRNKMNTQNLMDATAKWARKHPIEFFEWTCIPSYNVRHTRCGHYYVYDQEVDKFCRMSLNQLINYAVYDLPDYFDEVIAKSQSKGINKITDLRIDMFTNDVEHSQDWFLYPNGKIDFSEFKY